MAGKESTVVVEEFEKRKKRVLMEENRDPGTRNLSISTEEHEMVSRRVTETGRVSERGTINAGEWLVSIMQESDGNVKANRSRTKPRIQNVPELLRKFGTNEKFFKPEVVAIGPYHRSNPKMEAMEEHKKAAAQRFISNTTHSVDMFYRKVIDVAGKARECYADGFDELINDEDFAIMMFLDGCFILHFIDLFQKDRMKELTMSTHLQGFIMRDMFLLENQLPLVVLEALMSLKPVNLEEFINKIIGTTYKKPPLTSSQSSSTSVKGVEEGPFHLLDLLRIRLLGDKGQQPLHFRTNWHYFRSAMELKEVGIKFRKSKTSCLRDIKFEAGFIHGCLTLPPIVIDDSTKSRFLNLIAFEMCPDSASDYGITSYVWLLDCLIDEADDVKELRKKGILLNALGSDNQVAELFNELATDLAPDHQAYSTVMMEIDRHYNNKMRVSLVRMVHTHFSSPWTTIAFIAAVFLLLLTVVQTIYAVLPQK